MAMRLTSKKLTNYLIDKLNKREEEYKRVMNIAPDGSDALCERKIDEERDYLDYKAKNQDEYRYVKLGQLEDIEDEFGIDLITLFKALKHFWTFNHGEKVCIHYPFLRKNENCKKYELVFNQQAFGDTGIRDAHIFYYSVWLKDYGKTWALTKEELL